MNGVTTVVTGSRAEQAVSRYLIDLGFEIVEQNYRRKYCEIDIVARKAGTVYFVEVKYRADDHFGGGLDSIGYNKLRHMTRAARIWVAEHRWQGEYVLSAVEVGGSEFEVLEFVETIY